MPTVNSRPSKFAPKREPYGSGSKTSRSVRVSDDVWTNAQTKIKHEEGQSISWLISVLLAGYVNGKVRLPRGRESK